MDKICTFYFAVLITFSYLTQLSHYCAANLKYILSNLDSFNITNIIFHILL